jgi:hypothetical protein
MPAGDSPTGQCAASEFSPAEGIDSSRTLRGRNQSGRLDRNGFRTYGDPNNPPDVRTELLDFRHDIGECWISHTTAAALSKTDGFVLKKPFHATVLRGHNIQRVGSFIHTTTILPLIDRAEIDGVPVTSVTRTLIDIAAIVSPPVLVRAVTSAFRDGTSSEVFLHERLTALRGSGRAGCRRLLNVLEADEIANGRRSFLERRFLELVAKEGLPRPRTEVTLTKAGDKLVRVDCLFPGTNVVVELLGYRWHRTKEQMRRDAERLNQLQLDGFRGFQFTYDQVIEDPDGTMKTTRAALGR